MNDTPIVSASNHEQAKAWNGPEGNLWAQRADQYDDAVRAYHPLLMATAAISPSERVLDVGCGAGQTTLDAARAATSGHALGVDLSSVLLDVARQRASSAAVSNVDFLCADAQIHRFDPESFDVVLSRTGAMFFGDMPSAFSNLALALRPGGRLVLMAWQGPEPNEWMREIAGAIAGDRGLPTPPVGAQGPLALASPTDTKELLGQAGFADIRIEDVQQPMYFGSTVDESHDWLLQQFGWLLGPMEPSQRETAAEALRDTLMSHLTPEGVAFASGAWFITATRA